MGYGIEKGVAEKISAVSHAPRTVCNHWCERGGGSTNWLKSASPSRKCGAGTWTTCAAGAVCVSCRSRPVTTFVAPETTAPSSIVREPVPTIIGVEPTLAVGVSVKPGLPISSCWHCRPQPVAQRNHHVYAKTTTRRHKAAPRGAGARALRRHGDLHIAFIDTC